MAKQDDISLFYKLNNLFYVNVSGNYAFELMFLPIKFNNRPHFMQTYIFITSRVYTCIKQALPVYVKQNLLSTHLKFHLHTGTSLSIMSYLAKSSTLFVFKNLNLHLNIPFTYIISVRTFGPKHLCGLEFAFPH